MASSNPPSPSASGESVPDNITLRIVVLAHGNRAEDDLYLVLSLDTTVGELKQRIQDTLPQHPPPELQRLIYHGRPLVDATTSLRQTLRIVQRAGSASHVLHLVIRDEQSTALPPNPAQHAAINPQPQPMPQPLMQQGQLPILPGLPQAEHMRIHNQLHNMQHQVLHAQAMTRANHARQQAQQAMLQAHQPPQLPHLPQLHQAPNEPVQPALRPMPHSHTEIVEERIGPNGEHVRTTTSNNGTTSMTFRITGLNVPNPLDRPSSAPGSSPSAPSDPATRTTTAALPNIQINAQPAQLSQMPAGLPFPPTMQFPLPFPSMIPPAMHNFNTMNIGAMNASSAQTMAWLLSSPQGPQGIVFAPGHGLFTTTPSSTTSISHVQQQNILLQPTPTAPLTTAHHHGAAAPTQQQAQLVIRPQDGVAEIRRAGDAPAPPQPGARPQPPPAVGAPAPPQAQAGRQQNDQNDLIQLLITRGWLFLRLYMFVFVLSESGTWRRIFMLGFVIVFCLLPRQNPFTDAVQVVRRHFDNLIGPPPIPQRQAPPTQAPAQAQAQGQGQEEQNYLMGQHAQRADGSVPTDAEAEAARARITAQTNAPSGSRRQPADPMPTPEQAARRLLEQQNRRNPNPVLDVLYRVEQGIALFLASLIPGLGERHIQAREQARRILREEQEQRTREEAEARERDGQIVPGGSEHAEDRGSGSSHKNEGGPLPESWGTSAATNSGTRSGEASSTGIHRDSGNDSDDVRLRNSRA